MIETKETCKLIMKLFGGLADPSRLSILETLRCGPKNVSEIIEQTGLLPANASIHLYLLECCGLVDHEVRGRFSYYRITSRKVFRVLEATEKLLEDVKERIESCARYDGQM